MERVTVFQFCCSVKSWTKISATLRLKVECASAPKAFNPRPSFGLEEIVAATAMVRNLARRIVAAAVPARILRRT